MQKKITEGWAIVRNSNGEILYKYIERDKFLVINIFCYESRDEYEEPKTEGRIHYKKSWGKLKKHFSCQKIEMRVK